MQPLLRTLSILVAVCAFSGAVQGQPSQRTRDGDHRGARPTSRQAAAEKPVPFDPREVRRRQPGRFDFGNGTEVRIGGRVQADYDLRR